MSRLIVLWIALSMGCGAKQQEVVASSHPKGIDEDAVVEKGTANIDTWLVLEGYETKIRVPNGWEWEHRGVRVQAFAKGHEAGYVLTGAATKDEALKRQQSGHDALKLVLGAAKSKGETLLGGIKFVRRDYVGATADGKPVLAMELVGASLTGTGFVIALGFAAEARDEELREAINSVTKK